MQVLELAPRDINRESANECHGREKGPEVPNGKVRGDEPRDQHAGSDQGSDEPSPNEISSQLNLMSTTARPFPLGENIPPRRITVLTPVAAQIPPHPPDRVALKVETASSGGVRTQR